jgi:ABC-type microcin C transport system permease subunit YejE
MTPLVGDLQNAYLVAPGGRFLLGTDTQGRDVLSAVLFGARLGDRLCEAFDPRSAVRGER